jgi:phage baseplate assembly protein gpV
MSLSTPIAGLQSIVLTASITNMNGFLIVGVYDQNFDAVTMSAPTTTLIK